MNIDDLEITVHIKSPYAEEFGQPASLLMKDANPHNYNYGAITPFSFMKHYSATFFDVAMNQEPDYESWYNGTIFMDIICNILEEVDNGPIDEITPENIRDLILFRIL